MFSIVTPVYDPPDGVLKDMIRSVQRQTVGSWELILVDDRSPRQRTREILREAAERDHRVRVIERAENGHIVKASNDGVAAARGEFIALLDHDDLIVPRALEFMADAIAAVPEVDYLYSNEDKVDANGSFYDLFEKPLWSPERLRGQNYACHFSVLRTSVVREIGGFREGYDGSQDHDLILRATEKARRVLHIPRTLYHWRVVPGSAAGDSEAKPYAWDAGRRAVQDQLDRLGIDGTAEFGQTPGTYRIDRRLDPSLRVSVVIPTRGSDGIVWGARRHYVVEAVRSLVTKAGHDNLEVIVVFDGDTPDVVLQELETLGAPDLQLIPYTKRFNFSEKCNLGVAKSYGDIVVLLNDDLEISSDGFVAQLAAPLAEPDVGMTGARLLFEDTTIQHAGLVFDRYQLNHAFSGLESSNPGPFSALTVNRECSGLTGAAVALRREVYDEVGGMSEQLPVNFNDVDLSCKLGRVGYRQLWIAHATAYHFESRTRTPKVDAWEANFVAQRWDLPDRDIFLPGVARAAQVQKKHRRNRSANVRWR